VKLHPGYQGITVSRYQGIKVSRYRGILILKCLLEHGDRAAVADADAKSTGMDYNAGFFVEIH
jgi:hypothetical protein